MELFVDFDGVIGNTIEAIVTLYNRDYNENFEWCYVETWDFSELTKASPEKIDEYFNDQRFFEVLKPMENALEVLERLSKKHKIHVVTIGYRNNLNLKYEWCKQHLPYADFTGILLEGNADKSIVNMTGGMLIDDVAHNLATCSAKYRVCYGDEYVWNVPLPERTVRCFNWAQVEAYIDDLNV